MSRELVYPGITRRAALTDAPSGDAVTLRVFDEAGVDYLATTAVPEVGATGVYAHEYPAPTTVGLYFEKWTDTTTNVAVTDELEVVRTLPTVPPAGAPGATVYAQPDDLRLELDVDNTVLTDAAANRLIIKAQDRIDRLAGPVGVDTYTGGTGTGLKFTPDNLLGWQGAKLTRATVVIAVALYADPHCFEQAQYEEAHGPDFRVKTTRNGGMKPAGVQALILARQLLEEARLRRLIARMHTG